MIAQDIDRPVFFSKARCGDPKPDKREPNT